MSRFIFLNFLKQKVAVIHDKLDEGFKPEERYCHHCHNTLLALSSLKSEHNTEVRDCLVREVSLAHSDKYKEADVTGDILYNLF